MGCWELGSFLKRLQLLFLETVLTLLLLKIDGFPFFTFSERVSVAVNATHLIKYILEKTGNWQKLKPRKLPTLSRLITKACN